MTSPKAVLSWSPPALLVSIGWLAAVGAVVFAVVTSDRAGQVLLGVAALVLLLLTLHGTIARPRLAADSNGLTVRGLTRRQQWTWAEVNVRVVRTRRLGRQVSTLELDFDDTLLVLGWIDLGVAPEDVAEALRELRT
ncbi:PH domain-containing protein [Actinocrispum wychmicini]|uniref:PH (Pleckstrin Homology) domain-containing protein n=1 Tax=Actinocrispum wychmicini TaxID=1213861 RepID=A0A4R2JW20_9PSEU|nr:PH domain-containing protein [Actinocrispum wychmicini]TCO64643.1 PH (Pleckstrin Homology) domain-containing protein [Actinocrispum wychmicini]